MASTLRLPRDLDEQLAEYCASVGAAKSRVVVIALRGYLDGNTPALAVQPPDDHVEEVLAGDAK